MLKEIRAYLRRIGANAIVIPHNDDYFNEDLRPEDERLAYVTGFTGSAGMAIITPRQAVLFVDGRYVNQAKKQTTFKVLQVPRQTTVSEWFARFLRPNYIVAYDPWLQSVAQIDKWAEIFTRRGAHLLPTPFNPVDKFWIEKPKAKPVKTFAFPLLCAGKTTLQKVQPVRKILKQEEYDAFILTNADTVSWLLNKRSDAFEYNPVYLKRLIIYPKGEPVELNKNTIKALKGKIVAIDTYETPVKVKQDLIDAGASIHHLRNPFAEFQAVKNDFELKGIHQATLADSIAVCRFFAILPEKAPVCNEFNVTKFLQEFRQENLSYKHRSFADISAVGKNAALPHYQATEEQNSKLDGAKLYLLDTGGQYRCGTTDMTRTVALLDEVSPEIKTRYTQVLKGHIALARQIFPAGTTGASLDALARQYLWQDGADFDHGTGHGVGCYLNVHETPPSISPRSREVLKENMIVTNEPGFYAKNKFGIRIENMMQVVRAPFRKKGFLMFEMLTFVPFCDELIDTKMLTAEENAWIASYYTEILKRVYPHVDETTKKWILKQVSRWVNVKDVLTC
ncbi:MAG: aminopeptidase P family protein [Alphaproteobacteria bacterium]|nr:aminopeptidase P family protein [Alphaproteobacteria bacterium]